MKNGIGIWIVRTEAEPLGHLLASQLPGELIGKSEAESETNRVAFGRCFSMYSNWVLIMTTGIAVRFLKSLLECKATDPGVVVLDEAARFAVSLVGGHEGGANQLAYRVANIVNAVPVITTATEVLKPLVVGIGCRKDVSKQQIERAVMASLNTLGRTLEEVREVATIDVKLHEPGLVDWCQAHSVPLRSVALGTIAARSWVTEPSSWVRENLGIDGVCEPAALVAAPRGQLILRKTALDGVAVAIVEDLDEDHPS